MTSFHSNYGRLSVLYSWVYLKMKFFRGVTCGERIWAFIYFFFKPKVRIATVRKLKKQLKRLLRVDTEFKTLFHPPELWHTLDKMQQLLLRKLRSHPRRFRTAVYYAIIL